MTTDVAVNTSPAIALKGGLFTLTAIQIFNADLNAISEALDDKIKQAPNFFLNTPIVIDLNQLISEETIDLIAFDKLFREKKLIPVGIRSQNPKIRELALTANLAIMPAEKSKQSITKAVQPTSKEEQVQPPKREEPQATSSSTYASRLIGTPVRSGQQIYVPGGDLVILNSVSQGAELLAEGHIHIHGSLRGRALAGINGNKEAMIYCKSLEAELVSIAGQYRIIEDLKGSKLWKQSVCIQLKDDRLQIEAV